MDIKRPIAEQRRVFLCKSLACSFICKINTMKKGREGRLGRLQYRHNIWPSHCTISPFLLPPSPATQCTVSHSPNSFMAPTAERRKPNQHEQKSRAAERRGSNMANGGTHLEKHSRPLLSGAVKTDNNRHHWRWTEQ